MSCEGTRLNFWQILASALVKDSTTDEIIGINVQLIENNNCVPALDCNNNTVDPEAMVVQHAFSVDDCGNIALKIVQCDCNVQ
jgi:hypothetical protein